MNACWSEMFYNLDWLVIFSYNSFKSQWSHNYYTLVSNYVLSYAHIHSCI